MYHDKQRLHQLLNPQLYTKVPEMYLPPTLKMVGQYADENKRGYLSDIVKGVDRNEMLEAILSKVNIQLKQRK